MEAALGGRGLHNLRQEEGPVELEKKTREKGKRSGKEKGKKLNRNADCWGFFESV